MRANVVLAGGGMKGPVLAGCIRALEAKKVEICGLGGTSAGSVVAMLSALGYTGDELRDILLSTSFNNLLDDDGKNLERVLFACKRLNQVLSWSKSHLKKLMIVTTLVVIAIICIIRFSELSSNQPFHSALAVILGILVIGTPFLIGLQSTRCVLTILSQRYGVYRAARLRSFLAEKILSKCPSMAEDPYQVTFDQLEKHCHEVGKPMKPLRLVATDLDAKRAIVYGCGTENSDVSVLDAVVASSSFPFLFDPVGIKNVWHSDGGLSSNLPAFLFEREYLDSRTVTIAFDLVSTTRTSFRGDGDADYGLFLKSIIGSVLEASDVLIRKSTPGVSYFPIEVPDEVDTLDFNLTRQQPEACFTKGYQQASEQLECYPSIAKTRLSSADLKRTLMREYQAPRLLEPVMRAVIDQLDAVSDGELGTMRVHIMLLTGRKSETAESTRIVVYSVGMDDHADNDLEIAEDAGCSGQAWKSGQVAVADLDEARADPPAWKMSRQDHVRVPIEVKSMISAPIPGNLHSNREPSMPLGTLSVDCTARLTDTYWQNSTGEIDPRVAQVMRDWASVVGTILQ